MGIPYQAAFRSRVQAVSLANGQRVRNRGDHSMTTVPTSVPPQRFVISDIDIPFWRLVAILIKWALAAIPAAIVVTIIVMVIMGMLGLLFGMGSLMMFRPT
jgi:hypothetical protein